jgi:hypothetical protein
MKYIIHLAPTPNHWQTPEQRLRKALKVLLRSYGFRAVLIREELEAPQECKDSGK